MKRNDAFCACTLLPAGQYFVHKNTWVVTPSISNAFKQHSRSVILQQTKHTVNSSYAEVE